MRNPTAGAGASQSAKAFMLACVVVLALPGQGLAQSRPLKESEVTQRGLIDALAPDAQEASEADSLGKSRGFKLAQPAVPAKPKSQSILMTFASDSAVLSASTVSMLKVLAQALQSDKLASLQVGIEGHADPRGTEAHNLALSTARAQSVVDYLVNQLGLERSRFQAIGKGSSELINKSQPDAPENRRVTVVAKPL
jgi:outer membrane protein OmpA-like peptidoglycan-associated protein